MRFAWVHLGLVNLLLDHGAGINALSFGWTALHAAVGQANLQMFLDPTVVSPGAIWGRSTKWIRNEKPG